MRATEAGLINFDYTDFVNGTGIVSFYVVQTSTNGGNTWILTADLVNSTNLSGRFGNVSNVNVDLTPFNLPRVVKGIATLTGEFYYGGNSVYCTAKMQKVNLDTSVTDISSTITSQTVTAKAGLNLQIPLTQTVFKKGETLRLYISVVCNNDASGLIIDPTHIFVTNNTLKLNVPFRIDL